MKLTIQWKNFAENSYHTPSEGFNPIIEQPQESAKKAQVVCRIRGSVDLEYDQILQDLTRILKNRIDMIFELQGKFHSGKRNGSGKTAVYRSRLYLEFSLYSYLLLTIENFSETLS